MFPTIYDQFKKLKKSDVKINKKNDFFLRFMRNMEVAIVTEKKRNPRW